MAVHCAVDRVSPPASAASTVGSGAAEGVATGVALASCSCGGTGEAGAGRRAPHG